MEGDRKSKIVARKEELVSGVGERERYPIASLKATTGTRGKHFSPFLEILTHMSPRNSQ